MISLQALRTYFKQHPHYFRHTGLATLKAFWWRLSKQKVAAVNATFGLGDYVWIRNYLYELKRNGYKVVLFVRTSMSDFVEQLDSSTVDAIIPFFLDGKPMPDPPHRLDLIPFKFLCADKYFDAGYGWGNFIRKSIHAKNTYGANIIGTSLVLFKEFDDLFRPAINISPEFAQKLPILPIADKNRLTALGKPYVVLVEKGSQGRFSSDQISAMLAHFIDKGFNIFYNGDYKALCNSLPPQQVANIIDGYRYPLHEYMYVVKHAQLMVTPNTGLYHFATQLGCPCVVTSIRECLTLDLGNPIQRHLLDPKLNEAYHTRGIANLWPYEKYNFSQADFPIEQLIAAIDDLLQSTID